MEWAPRERLDVDDDADGDDGDEMTGEWDMLLLVLLYDGNDDR